MNALSSRSYNKHFSPSFPHKKKAEMDYILGKLNELFHNILMLKFSFFPTSSSFNQRM